jgi:hypothetical protein
MGPRVAVDRAGVTAIREWRGAELAAGVRHEPRIMAIVAILAAKAHRLLGHLVHNITRPTLGTAPFIGGRWAAGWGGG